MRDTFVALSENELASYELRPVNLEERYIQEISGDKLSTENYICKSANKNELSGESLADKIVIKDLYFTYNPKKYLFFKKKLSPADENICTLRIPFLSAKLGEIIGITGNNGSGKSTFLRCLCGLEKTCIASVSIDGKIMCWR